LTTERNCDCWSLIEHFAAIAFKLFRSVLFLFFPSTSPSVAIFFRLGTEGWWPWDVLGMIATFDAPLVDSARKGLVNSLVAAAVWWFCVMCDV
jgi:hypothetical protein